MELKDLRQNVIKHKTDIFNGPLGLPENSLSVIRIELSKLISSKLLNDKIINDIFLKCNEIFDYIVETTSQDIQLNVIYWFEDLLQSTLEKTIELEFFESSANIKKFIDIYNI